MWRGASGWACLSVHCYVPLAAYESICVRCVYIQRCMYVAVAEGVMGV